MTSADEVGAATESEPTSWRMWLLLAFLAVCWVILGVVSVRMGVWDGLT